MTKRQLDFSGPIIETRTPMPVELWTDLLKAIETTCRSRGLECYVKQETGLGVVHVRPLTRKAGSRSTSKTQP